MKLWIDDCRPAPEGWHHCRSVHEGKIICCQHLKPGKILNIETMSFDHDAGDYYSDGGDYIRILDWLEEHGYSYPIHIHSMNSVGVQNMRSIIRHNCWTEIK